LQHGTPTPTTTKKEGKIGIIKTARVKGKKNAKLGLGSADRGDGGI
jgi:hypothetical protein